MVTAAIKFSEGVREYESCKKVRIPLNLRRFRNALANWAKKGLGSLEGIRQKHEAWRNDVLSGAQPPNLETDQSLWDAYSEWAKITEMVLSATDEFCQNCNVTIAAAEKLRAAAQSLRDEMAQCGRPEKPLRPLSVERLRKTSNVNE